MQLKSFVVEHTTIVSPPLLPEIALRLATEIDPLWRVTQAWLDEKSIAPPYWAFAWVGGQALARFVLDHREIVAKKRVLDFASGSGVVGIAARLAGAAHVVATEIDPLAVEAIRSNASHNGVTIDARAIDLVDDALDELDVVLAGDVCYEQPMADRVGGWLRDRARAGRDVILGDPGRSYLLPPDALVEIARYDVASFSDVEGSSTRSTGVFRVVSDR